MKIIKYLKRFFCFHNEWEYMFQPHWNLWKRRCKNCGLKQESKVPKNKSLALKNRVWKNLKD